MPENCVTRVRIGDASSLELFAVLDPERTLREGLERVLTRAHEVSAIPRSVRLDDPEVSIDGRRVDPDEIVTRIPELTQLRTRMLVVRTQTTPVRMKIRLSRKGLKGSASDIGSQDLIPSEPVGAELNRIGLMSAVEDREWFGRAPSAVNDLRVEWHGPDGKRRVLDLALSLWEQRIRTSGELHVARRVGWEWPPKPTLPPPWSGFTIGVLLLAAILGFGGYLLLWEPDRYDVTFVAPAGYGKTKVAISSSGSPSEPALSLDSNSQTESEFRQLEPGNHLLRVTPQFVPPYDTTIVLRGRVKERRVELPNHPGRTVDTVLKVELRDLEEHYDDWVAGDEKAGYEAQVNGYPVKATSWISGSPEIGDGDLEPRAGGLHWLTFVDKHGESLSASRAKINMVIIANDLGEAPFRLPIMIPENAERYLIWTNVIAEPVRSP